MTRKPLIYMPNLAKTGFGKSHLSILRFKVLKFKRAERKILHLLGSLQML